MTGAQILGLVAFCAILAAALGVTLQALFPGAWPWILFAAVFCCALSAALVWGRGKP